MPSLDVTIKISKGKELDAMTQGVLHGVRVFAKNIVRHTMRVFRRKETLRDAFKNMRHDSHKLKNLYRHSYDQGHYEAAKKLAKKGRSAYNDGNFESAADYFHQAIETDIRYAYAYTYLGHTYYKLNRLDDALHYWRQATEVDPNSEAAEKARRKIAMAEEQKKSVYDWMRDVQGD